MKYFAVLLIASLCVAVYSEQLDAEPRGIKNTVVSAAKKLKGALNSALSSAKGKLNEFVQALGEQKGPALAMLNELKEQLKAEAKATLAQAVNKVQKAAAQKLVEELNKLVEELNKTKEKIEQLQ